MGLEENISYIEKLKRFGIKPGLQRAEKALNILGNPHKSFKSVHITGTNGKGSTSTMIASILKEAGYKTGLYLSPYVVSFNERIQINGIPIDNEKLDSLITDLRNLFEENKFYPTFFEFITALAFLHFSQEKVDIAVVEVGMGGRLDATNVIDSLVSVITNVGLDHVNILGKTREQIAVEKAGIIKENQTCITAEEDSKIRGIFSKICGSKNSKLVYTKDHLSSSQEKETLDYQTFKTTGVINSKFKLKLLGGHQIKNAEVALLVCEELRKEWKRISDLAIYKGLANANIRGRLEVYSREPLMILDGAHNSHGMKVVSEFIEQIGKKSTLIIGISEDKDSDGMLKLVAPNFDRIIATQSNYKPKDLRELVEEARRYNKNVITAENVKEALSYAKEKDDGLVLITGSLYLVSAAIHALENIQESTIMI